MSSEFIYCMECGTRLPAEARFCNVCGTRIMRADASDQPPHVWGEPAPAETQTTSAAIELPAAGAGTLDMTVGDDDDESHPPSPAASWGSPETAAEDSPAVSEPVVPPEQRAAAVSWEGPSSLPSSAADMKQAERQDFRREDLDRPMPQEVVDGARPAAPAYYDDDAGGFSLRPGLLMAAIGFAVALVGVFLPWVSVTGRGDADAFSNNAIFQISDLLDNSDPIDGYVVIGLAAAGLLFLVVEYVALRRLPIGRVFAALGGLAMGGLGVVELLYIRDAAEMVDYKYGAGLFMVIVGGATAIVGSLIPVGYDEPY